MSAFYHYSYGMLMQDHLRLSAFLLLIFTILVFYVFKHHFIRGVFFFLTMVFGLYSGSITWLGLGLILLLGLLFYLGFEGKQKGIRLIGFVGIFLYAASMFFMNSLPGVIPWQVASHILLSEDARPYTMAFSFDQALFGLFFIWFSPESLANGGKWKNVLKQGFFLGFLAAFILIPASILLGYVKFDFKWTNFFALFAVHNLFFVCLAEEAFFRGILQKGLTLGLQSFKGGKWLALILVALLFGAAHFQGGFIYMGLATLAGLFYGYAFLKTSKIEASVLTHWLVNLIHFIGFTYPTLYFAL